MTLTRTFEALKGSFERLAASRRLPPIEPMSVPSYVLLLATSSIVACAFLLTSFTYDGSLTGLFGAVAAIAACAWGLRYLSLPRLAAWIEATALKFSISTVVAIGSPIVAATAMPLADGSLIRWDAALGFSWTATIRWLWDKPSLIELLHLTYDSLPWQWVMVIPLLLIARQEERLWTFILAWGVALLTVLAVFPFFPAAGPLVHYQVALPGLPYKDDFMDVFMGARDGTLRELGAATIRGMVTMPSFHAGGAVLLGWAFAGIRWVGIPFVVLNLLMFFSAIPIGGHYAVDILAGGVIAAGAIVVSQMLVRWIVAIRSAKLGAEVIGFGTAGNLVAADTRRAA